MISWTFFLAKNFFDQALAEARILVSSDAELRTYYRVYS
jgi:hypothetical protein